MKENILRCCQNSLDRWIDVKFTLGYLDSVISKDQDFCESLVTYYSGDSGDHGLDTLEREVLMDLIAKDIVGRDWPMNMDGPEVMNKFRFDFANALYLRPEIYIKEDENEPS